MSSSVGADNKDIAVVGIGCRFPGADNIDEFWKVLVNGENHVTDIPPDRWNADFFFSENKDEQGKAYVKKAGLLNSHDEWDNRLFGVSDNEAACIDPQQRYVLECTHMALEDGGITRKEIGGTKTGVFIGVMNDDYKGMSSVDHSEDSNYTATGLSTTVIASRLSFVFNLQGPCMVVDTACSSSLVAMHLGCQALRTGDCEMAICGGVNSILAPDMFITLCRARMISATGQCQTFCDSADGYARGEGCGIIILKSLCKAVLDGNKIWGVIKTGTNQDGHVAQPMTAPSGEQQYKLLEDVYNTYQVHPKDLQYIEVHGTGTPIGDPTEVNAIGKFVSSFMLKNKSNDEHDRINDSIQLNQPYCETQRAKHILIGSVKSNIGHTEAAAGVAGLIKVLLMMVNGKIVPSLHVKKDKSNVNKRIILDNHGLDIALETTDWVENERGERLACVNSFGFGGSNGHCIVYQHKEYSKPNKGYTDESCTTDMRVICISAIDKTSLKNNLECLCTDIELYKVDLRDISATSFYHRDHFPCRTILFGRTLQEIINTAHLQSSQIQEIKSRCATQIIFVFCGVGTTWPGMTKDIMTEQSVLQTVRKIDEYLEPLTGWTTEKLFMEKTNVIDPFLNHLAIFSTQVALFELWKSYNVVPDVIIGQSVGEVAAAYASGALSLKDAVQVIFVRSKILAEQTGGKMLVVGNSNMDEIESICKMYDGKVTIAVYNSATSCTLSGEAEAIDHLYNNIKNNKDLLVRLLNINCAYHSHMMEPCLEDIKSKIVLCDPGQTTVPHISTVTGAMSTSTDFRTGEYWAENVRKPVKFMQAIRKATREDLTNVYLEIGPRQVLKIHLPNVVEPNIKALCLPSMNANDTDCFYRSLSKLYELGRDINFKPFLLDSFNQRIAIPKYHFNRKKALFVAPKTKLFLGGNLQKENSHLFFRESTKSDFKIVLTKETTSFVYEHLLDGSLIVPGATYVEAALQLAFARTDACINEITVKLQLLHTCTPPDTGECLIQFDGELGEKEGELFTFTGYKDDRYLCKGSISHRISPGKSMMDVEAIRRRLTKTYSQAESYACLKKIGFSYGESMTLIQKTWTERDECLVEIIIPKSVKKESKKVHIHPSIIDSMFQTFAIINADTRQNEGEGAVPHGFDSFSINRMPQERMFVYSRLVRKVGSIDFYNSILLTPEGIAIAEIVNFRTKSTKMDTIYTSVEYKVLWEEKNVESTKDTSYNKKILMFGTKRCINWLRKRDSSLFIYIELGTDFPNTKRRFLETLENNPGVDTIIFAPCSHINEESHVNNIFKFPLYHFLTVQALISMVTAKQLHLSIVVVTEETQSVQTSLCTNIYGSELWGFVRSARIEVPHINFTLIDVELDYINIETFSNVLMSPHIVHAELAVRNGSLYTFKVDISLEEKETALKARPFEALTSLKLRSMDKQLLKEPFFLQIPEKSKEGRVNCKQICLQSICLHDSRIVPLVSNEDKSSLYQCERYGFPVVVVEGYGQLLHNESNVALRNKKHMNDGDDVIGFCYPVEAAAVVNVDEECIFKPKKIPNFVPGIISKTVISFNLCSVCPKQATVLLVIEQSSSVENILLPTMLKSLRKAINVTVLHTHELDQFSSEISNVNAILLLCYPKEGMLEKFTNLFPKVSIVITLDHYIQNFFQALKIVTNYDLHIVRIDEIFKHEHLKISVPKVLRWLQQNTNSNQLRSKTENRGKERRLYNGQINDDTLKLVPFDVYKIADSRNTTTVSVLAGNETLFQKDGCYLFVGGLTGLGKELIKYTAEFGAGFIATLSRRKPSLEQLDQIKTLEKRYGCKIICQQTDITVYESVLNAILTIQKLIKPACIKGIFHGGGLLNDGLLENMSEADASQAMLPKIVGTWNLHEATKHLSLEYFVMHSSIVSIIGNPGQCNYAAGNSFQDSFALYRQSLGLCGQSINWGALPFGMAHTNDIENKLKSQGIYVLSNDDVKSSFLKVLQSKTEVQLMFANLNWVKIQTSGMLSSSSPSKYKDLFLKLGIKTRSSGKSTGDEDVLLSIFDDNFKVLEESQQQNLTMTFLRRLLSELLVVQPEDIDENTTLFKLGIDSMVAMSLNNGIFQATKLRLSVVSLLSESTSLKSLAKTIIQHMNSEKSTEHVNERSVGENATEHLSYLDEQVTFMQRRVLDSYRDNPKRSGFISEFNFEFNGFKVHKKEWKTIISLLFERRSELRTIYIQEISNGTLHYKPLIVSMEELAIPLKFVSFDNVFHDKKEDVIFDLTKEVSVRFLIGTEKRVSRINIQLHIVMSDLKAISLIIEEIGLCMRQILGNVHLQNPALPNIPLTVKQDLSPRMDQMRTFWSTILVDGIEPFTFTGDTFNQLDEAFWKEVTVTVPDQLIEQIKHFLKQKGLTLYNFVMAVYMVVLYGQTSKTLIPILTNYDIRAHVPSLRNVITRCVNEIPVVGEVTMSTNIDLYLRACAERFNNITENGSYPFELIQKQMQSESLRQLVSRHKLTMEDLSVLNALTKGDGYTIRIQNVAHRRKCYESCLYVYHDLKERKLIFEYGYNSEALDDKRAGQIVNNIMAAMQMIIDNHEIKVGIIVSALQFENNVDFSFSSTDQTTKTFEACCKTENSYNSKMNELETSTLNGKQIKTGTCGLDEIVKEGYLCKQTLQGFVHRVHAQLSRARDTQSEKCATFQWGTRKKRKTLAVKDFEELHVKCINGSFCLYIKTASGWSVFVCDNKSEALEWFQKLKKETQNDLENQSESCWL